MALTDSTTVLLELGISSPTDDETTIVTNAIIRATGAIRRWLGYDPESASRTEYYPQRDFDPSSLAAVWEVEGSDAVLRRLAHATTNTLFLRHIPVRSITSLWVDLDGRSGTSSGAFGSGSLKTEGTDYWPNNDLVDSDGNDVCRDGVIRSHGRWPTTPGTVKVTYIGGYTAGELAGTDVVIDASPIVTAVVVEAVRRARGVLLARSTSATGAGGAGHAAGLVTSERLGDYSYNLGGGGGSNSAYDRLYGGLFDLLPESKELLQDYRNYSFIIAS